MSDDALKPGTVVGETYQVDELIGRGAMGQVYSAHHLRLPALHVAIKVVIGQTIGNDRLLRFRREAEIAAKLSQPNIVQVIDYNVLPSGQPYLVMELLRGESLYARLKKGPVPLPTLRRIVREVGAALEAAHRAGVVHRDLKPENIFLVPTPTGDQAKVLDFGISKMVDTEGLIRTSDSVIIGTPRYMSPEQAMGLNSQLTAQSDVYSLAVVCYEALTGQVMFKGDNVAHLLYQITQSPPPPMPPEVPLPVVRALEHALEKDPKNRTPDAMTFVREFAGQASAAAQAVRQLRPSLAVEQQVPTRNVRVVKISRLGSLIVASVVVFSVLALIFVKQREVPVVAATPGVRKTEPTPDANVEITASPTISAQPEPIEQKPTKVPSPPEATAVVEAPMTSPTTHSWELKRGPFVAATSPHKNSGRGRGNRLLKRRER